MAGSQPSPNAKCPTFAGNGCDRSSALRVLPAGRAGRLPDRRGVSS